MNVHLIVAPATVPAVKAVLAGRGHRSSCLADDAMEGRSFSGALSGWMLMDVSVGWEDGLALIERLSPMAAGVGIVVTGARQGLDGCMRAYALGADFVLSRPVLYEELRAMALSLACRIAAAVADPVPALPPPLTVAIDNAKLTVMGPRTQVALTLSEHKLLRALAHAADHQLTFAQIGQLMGYEERRSSRMTALVWRLRQKLDRAADMDASIRAIKSVGYQLMVPVAVDEPLALMPLLPLQAAARPADASVRRRSAPARGRSGRPSEQTAGPGGR